MAGRASMRMVPRKQCTQTNISIIFRSKRVNRPPPPDQKNFTRMPMPSPSANPDYTGFAHMLHSDDEDGSQSGNVDGDNLSLIDEIDAALPGQHSKPEKRPNRKPPKPPGK